MTEIKTNRLKIIPMTHKELSVLIKSCKDTLPELSTAYQEMLDNCIKYPKDFLWYTSWKICLYDNMKEVGYAGFKGLINGYAEIGYGINKEYQKNGYATEAVKALCCFALDNPQVKGIEAETESDNRESSKVLLKVGFTKTGKIGEEGPRYILYKSKL